MANTTLHVDVEGAGACLISVIQDNATIGPIASELAEALEFDIQVRAFVVLQLYGVTPNSTRVSISVTYRDNVDESSVVVREAVDGDATTSWMLVVDSKGDLTLEYLDTPRALRHSLAASRQNVDSDQKRSTPFAVDIERSARAIASGTAPQRAQRESLHVPVFYGTSRAPKEGGQSASADYTNDLGQALRVGVADVEIPATHRLGELDPPLWRRIFAQEDGIRLGVVTELEEAQFAASVAALLEGIPEAATLLFVHGYNTSFSGALRRAAQLAYDLGHRGLVAAYSWPSSASWYRYFADEARFEHAEEGFGVFVELLLAASSTTPLYIVSHSMGNRVTLRALKNRKLKGEDKLIAHCIFAAPDVTRQKFIEYAGHFSGTCSRATMYVSSGDLALKLSGALHSDDRAGKRPPTCVAPNTHTVDCGELDPTFLGHSFFASLRAVVEDMRGALAGLAPDQDTRRLKPVVDADGAYWTLSV